MPVLARGAGSSLTGAAVLKGAIVLDMRAMDKVIKVDTVNWYVQVQPGISLEDLNRELKALRILLSTRPREQLHLHGRRRDSGRVGRPQVREVRHDEGLGAWPSGSSLRTER